MIPLGGEIPLVGLHLLHYHRVVIHPEVAEI